MENDTGKAPDGEALPINWDEVRARYEKGEEQVKAIAASIGWIGINLSRHAKAMGWKLRGAVAAPIRILRQPVRAKTTGETIRRLKDLLTDRIANLESEIKALGQDIDELSNEKKLRSVNMVVRTLEKVIDLERKDKLAKQRQARAFKLFDESQRGALAEKIERLEEGWQGEGPVAGAEPAGSGGAEPPVALLGPGEPAASA